MGKKAKVERKPRVRQQFEPTAKAVKEDTFGPQASLVYNALQAKAPADARAVGEAIKGKLETKQDPVRVAAFYLAQFRADGFARLAKKAPKSKASA